MGYVKPRLSYDSFIVKYIAENIACCCSCSNNDHHYDVFTGLKHICLIMFILYVYNYTCRFTQIKLYLYVFAIYSYICFDCIGYNPVFEK